MFTGIVREIGKVVAIDRGPDGARLRVGAGLAGDVEPGDSVAVAGTCLTVAERADGAFSADVSGQTLSLTTLGELAEGAAVNLEPALRAGDPLGGHLVQGHVDGTAEIGAVRPAGDSTHLEIALSDALSRYVVEHGSVAVDGVSLTVARLGPSSFEVALIPETLARTTLGSAQAGDRVNVEVDVVGRYVERLLPESRGED
jgi:riboflavin synthase alpha subunit